MFLHSLLPFLCNSCHCLFLLFSHPLTCCSKLQLQPLKCSYFWPRGRKALATLPGFAISSWEQGMRKIFKGAGWVWGRLWSAQSWVGANLFPWTTLNKTQAAKSILKVCHGLLRYLGFKNKCLKCEMLVPSQLWDELGACGFSQLAFKSVGEMQASKYEAGLEQELVGFAPLPWCGLVPPTSLPVEPGCGQTLQPWGPRKCSRNRDSYKDVWCLLLCLQAMFNLRFSAKLIWRWASQLLLQLFHTMVCYIYQKKM